MDGSQNNNNANNSSTVGSSSNQNGDNSVSTTGGRGFASMDPNKQRKIASKGGKAAHKNGSAHEFNSEEAKKAGQKGGKARAGKATQE